MRPAIPSFIAATIITATSLVHAQVPVFSGPQAGEKLPPLKVAATFRGTIRGETIDWGQPHQLPLLTLSYYQDLQQDSQGHFTASGRVLHRDDDGQPAGITIGNLGNGYYRAARNQKVQRNQE